MSTLWFELLRRQRQRSFGLTLPFLIGATRVPVGTVSGDSNADFADLCKLLADFQANTPHGYYVGIAKCTTLKEPVAAAYDGAKPSTHTGLEQIGAQGALYASHEYQTNRSMDSLAATLWGKVEVSLSVGRFSFTNGEYANFTDDDLDFIRKSGDRSTLRWADRR